MFVLIPTAIPQDPFKKRFKVGGKTSGSFLVLS